MSNQNRIYFGDGSQDVFLEFDPSIFTPQHNTDDVIRLRGGDDIALVFGGDDLIFGGGGDDIIRIQPNDTEMAVKAFGGSGDDQFNIFMHSLTASLRGGSGNDDFVIIFATDELTFAHDGRKTIIEDGDSIVTLRGVEHIDVIDISETGF